MQLKAAIEVDVSNQLSLLKSGGDSRFENAGGQGRRRWTVLTGGGGPQRLPRQRSNGGGKAAIPPRRLARLVATSGRFGADKTRTHLGTPLETQRLGCTRLVQASRPCYRPHTAPAKLSGIPNLPLKGRESKGGGGKVTSGGQGGERKRKWRGAAFGCESPESPPRRLHQKQNGCALGALSLFRCSSRDTSLLRKGIIRVV